MACDLSGVSRSLILSQMKKDPYFADEVKEAQEAAFDRLEGEAYQRAVHGVLEPVFHKGYICGDIRKYSDSLLIKMLEANNPKYKKVPIIESPESVDLSKLSNEELDQLEKILNKTQP